jgi:hypothetical protein
MKDYHQEEESDPRVRLLVKPVRRTCQGPCIKLGQQVIGTPVVGNYRSEASGGVWRSQYVALQAERDRRSSILEHGDSRPPSTTFTARK